MARLSKRDDASTAQAHGKAIADTSRLARASSGVWYVHYSYPVVDARGTVQRWRSDKTSTRTRDDQEAVGFLSEWVAKARAQVAQAEAAKGKTISEIIDAYIEHCPDRSQVYALATVNATLGHMLPGEINDTVLRDYTRTRRNTRTNDPVSPSTLRRELGALRSALRYGADHKLFPRVDLPVIKTEKESAPRVKFMEADVEERFYAEAQLAPGQLGLFVAIGLDTAARREAILQLTWDRIDFARKLIDFQVKGMRKTRKRRTVVPINTRLMPILQHAAVVAKAKRGVLAGRLFENDPRRLFEKFAQGMGLPWVTPHVMRHTWASLAAIRGESLLQIAKYMADTYKTVEETYAHLQPTHLHDVANRRWAA